VASWLKDWTEEHSPIAGELAAGVISDIAVSPRSKCKSFQKRLYDKNKPTTEKNSKGGAS
jgi:hypothetical protein